MGRPNCAKPKSEKGVDIFIWTMRPHRATPGSEKTRLCLIVPHGRPYLLHHNLDIFIDVSCFYSKCRRFARAAVGSIYSPEVGSFSFPVKGADHSSQRAEIFALAIAP